MDIFVIRESVVVPYLQDAYFDHQLPVLPPHVDLVSLTWQAKDDKVSLGRTGPGTMNSYNLEL